MAYDLTANRHWESCIHSSEDVPLLQVLFNMWCWGCRSNINEHVLSHHHAGLFSTALSLRRIKKQKQQIQPFQKKLHCGYYEVCERRSSGSYRHIITLVSVLMCRQAAVLWVCMHAGLFQSCRLMTREERVKQFAVSQSFNGDIFSAMEQDITSSSLSWESVRSEHVGVKSCLEIKQGLVLGQARTRVTLWRYRFIHKHKNV